MTDGNNEKPQTDAQASRALAQQLGKLAALVLLVIIAILFQRYCSYKPPPFGPGAKIVSIDGDTLRAGDGSEYRIFGIDAPELPDLQGGQRQVLGLQPRGEGAAHHTDQGRQRELHGAGQGPFRPDRGSMQRGRSARSWRRDGAPRLCHRPRWRGRQSIPSGRGRGASEQARHMGRNLREAVRLAPGPSTRERIDRIGAYAASGSACPGCPGSPRPTISAMVLMKAWAPSISAASCSQEWAVSR
jgi:hypothetical protein